MRKYEKASKGEMTSAMKKIIEYMKGSVGIVAVALVLAALGAIAFREYVKTHADNDTISKSRPIYSLI